MSELSAIRNGNFTSSEIHCLAEVGSRPMTEFELAKHKAANPKSRVKSIETPFSKPAMTYIEECNYERRLNRSIDSESNAKPTIWGKVLEAYVFKYKLGTEYEGHFNVTKRHPSIPEWCGSVDAIRHGTPKAAADVKCPFTMKSFCKLVDPVYEGMTGNEAMKAIREGWVDKRGVKRKEHTDGDKFYWQVVSNAIINGCEQGELLIFCPKRSDIPKIQTFVSDDADCKVPSNKTAFMNWGTDADLPWIEDNGYYKELTSIRFDIPESDIVLLTNKVLMARTMLIPYNVAA